MELNLGHEIWMIGKRKKKKKEKEKTHTHTHTLVLKMTNLASTHDLEKMIIEIL